MEVDVEVAHVQPIRILRSSKSIVLLKLLTVVQKGGRARVVEAHLVYVLLRVS